MNEMAAVLESLKFDCHTKHDETLAFPFFLYQTEGIYEKHFINEIIILF